MRRACEDIGFFFLDNDPQYKGIDSILKRKHRTFIGVEGFRINNLDSTVCLEKPKISSYIPEMRKIISSILNIWPENVSIKATTTEKMGFTGREEGIVALSVVTLIK